MDRYVVPMEKGGESPALFFPPFFEVPSSLKLKSFQEWDDYGVWLVANSDSHTASANPTVISQDNNNNPLLTVGLPFNIPFEEKQEIQRSKRREADHRRKDARGRPGVRLKQEDCWKIGHAESWEEPAGRSSANYDESIPPFSRILDATRDFIYSRHEEFQFHRNKRLFDLLRNALGLKSSFIGNHWPGSGPNATEYIEPKSNARHNPAPIDDDHDQSARGTVPEVCVLLRAPETSIRGLLALARRETEGGWDFEPAHKFSIIAAAFMSFLVHHDVLSEPSLNSAMRRACEVARSAPQALLDAKALEDVVGLGTSWNRAAWTIFGGSWGGAERGGLEKESITWGEQNVNSSVNRSSGSDIELSDDGGWSVEPVVDKRPLPLTKDEAQPYLAPLLTPLELKDISLLHYIPYSRRRITAILLPCSHPGVPSYANRCHRLVTVPAPWTSAEKWRTQPPRFDDPGSESDESHSSPTESSLPLDQEVATIDEPDELIIWVENKLFHDDPGMANRLLGAGLRGRWGLMGEENGSQNEYTQWWAFKAKNYILAAFWSQPTQ